MPSRFYLPALAFALALSPAALSAGEFDAQIKARQGQMQILALNLGVLGNMARGKAEYDAAQAQEAADNLVAIAAVSPTLLWPEGSAEGSKSKESVWTEAADFNQKWADVLPAAQALAEAAGDPATLGAGLGGLGGTCSACHRAHRAR